jgi:hypothetical protein
VIGFVSSHDHGVLSLDFFNHLLSGITDSTHGEGREPVREHRSEQESSKGVGVEDINLNLDFVSFTNTSDEGTEESEGDESGGSDGETFTDSGGSVTSGIELISGLADTLLKVGHLSNTTGVIGDRAVSVNSKGNREASEHTDSGKGNTVHGSEVEGNEDGGTKADNWDDVGHVSESESLDDIGSGSEFTRLGKVLSGAVFVGGVVLSGGTDDHTGPESHSDTSVKFPLSGNVGGTTELHFHGNGEHVDSGDDSDGHEDSGDNELVEELSVNVHIDLGEPLGNERNEDTNGSDNEGEVDSVASVNHREASGGDDESSASRFSERSEKISTHSSDITDIVTDVIGNSSGVSGRIFLKSVSDFTGKISTDISSLSVDTTTDSSEKGNSGATETVSGDVFEKNSNLRLNEFTTFLGLSSVFCIDNRALVGEDEDLEDDKSESDEHESEDLSTSESNIKSSLNVVASTLVGNFDVSLGSNLHSDESADHGGDGSDEESESGVREPHKLSSLIRGPRHIDGAYKDDTEDGAEDKEVSVFFFEESDGTLENKV